MSRFYREDHVTTRYALLNHTHGQYEIRKSSGCDTVIAGVIGLIAMFGCWFMMTWALIMAVPPCHPGPYHLETRFGITYCAVDQK